jgi:site-specific DNA-methyltransferase (adenine-specific)
MQLALLEPAAPPAPTPKNTAPWASFDRVLLYHGDCIDVLNAMPANCVDAGVTDPPYGLGFMGKEWDTFKPGEAEKRIVENHAIESDNPNLRGRTRGPASSPSAVDYDRSLTGQRAFQAWTTQWARALHRVLKPGAHLAVCGAPRSSHRMICGLEDAGFEIRDAFAWLFGQGFPKSHNLDGGLGTALKPGHEPIVLARKPFAGTIEENVARWGVGALNIEACRLGDGSDKASGGNTGEQSRDGLPGGGITKSGVTNYDIGRWPANVLLDEAAAALLDAQGGTRTSGANPTRRNADKFRRIFGNFEGEDVCQPARGAESGGASRFFFVAKPSRLEPDFGCDDLPMLTPGELTDREEGSAGLTPYAGAGRSSGSRNPHPTVKPVSLMRYLLRLVCPAGGVVVDTFVGSGTTGMAAVVDGYYFIGMDREEQYLVATDARIRATAAEARA